MNGWTLLARTRDEDSLRAALSMTNFMGLPQFTTVNGPLRAVKTHEDGSIGLYFRGLLA